MIYMNTYMKDVVQMIKYRLHAMSYAMLAYHA